MSDDDLKAFGHDEDGTLDEIEVEDVPAVVDDEILSLDELGDEEDSDSDTFDDIDDL